MSSNGLHHGRWATRPIVWGREGIVGSGTPTGSMAGIRTLLAGGNAVDAAVATGLAASVLEPTAHNTIGGEVAIILYLAGKDEVISIAGQGWAPKAATIDLYKKTWGEIPMGIPRVTVPGAVAAWLTALEKYGTLSFSEVAGSALDLARKGFVAYRYFSQALQSRERLENIRKWPHTARTFLPKGRPPEVGELFFQEDLGQSIGKMMSAEEMAIKKGKSREESIKAAEDVFYRGELAREMVQFLQERGGLFVEEDFSEFSSQVEKPILCSYKDYEIYGNGAWTQSLVFMEALKILEEDDLTSLGHNSPEFIHLVVEALKLSFYDREKWVGDPNFVEVPVAGLISKEYARSRRSLVLTDRARREYPPGDPKNGAAVLSGEATGPHGMKRVADSGEEDGTTHLAVADRWGNMVAATPSTFAGLTQGMVAGSTGVLLNTRGCYFFLEPENPNALAPRKRPRTTPHVFFIKKRGQPFMTLGTPGADSQPQSNLQVFLNIVEFGMDVQEAVSAPRFQTSSFPQSSWPHRSAPSSLILEGRISREVAHALEAKGHVVTMTSDWGVTNGFVPILFNAETGVYAGGADPRRESYVIGW